MFRSHMGATENLGSTKYICIKYYEIINYYIEIIFLNEYYGMLNIQIIDQVYIHI